MNTSAGEGDRDDLAGWHRMSNARDQVAAGVGSRSAVATVRFYPKKQTSGRAAVHVR